MLKRWHGIGMCFLVGTLGLGGLVTASLDAAPEPEKSKEKTDEAPKEITWAFRPLATPTVPPFPEAFSRWGRSPVDAFILAKLQEKKLAPSPEADRRTLIRRLYVDLIGLLPTPAEVDAFLADKSPDAYEKLVDHLLASPHYGERWARHWMDAVHFAETHGHDQDRVRANAWRYRDYLIDAFNSDRPYARFVQEQIAADVLFPDAPQAIPALGFLAAGPWDESSLKDIREDTIDRQIGHYLDRDDMVTTTMSTFASLTVHCARCHDHKFDPISQAEYYRLQAVFAGVGRGNLAFDTDPTAKRRRQELALQIAKLEKSSPEWEAHFKQPAMRQEIGLWEKPFLEGPRWQPAEIVHLVSEEGATLTKLPDGSIRSEGKRPETDRYIVTLRSNLVGITAIRLELLPDEKLPHQGPGRQDNGNLHLSEFQLHRLKTDGADKGTLQRVELQTPTSDYDQPGWTIQHSVDGNPKTAWGIYPQVSRAHQAIYPLRQPSAVASDWVCRLEQLHGGGHLIGRFRLSVTNALQPTRVQNVSPDLRALMDIPSDKRTDAQWAELGRHYLREKSQQELNSLPQTQMVYGAASNFMGEGGHQPFAKPRVVHLLKRGEIRRPGEEAKPGTLAALSELEAVFSLPADHKEGARRAALAQWITSPKNPLTWRSIVNRIWHHHFGRGLVDTPNDFGKMGGLPSHPELLDWLAKEFRDQGGSIKKLHRLLVTSSVYRQSSQHHPDFAKIDADNRLLWRMPRARLDAETTRDAILQVSDRLDRKAGGPSDQQFSMKPGIHVTPLVDYTKFAWDRPEGHRRSVYRFIFRTLPDPLVDCLDGVDSSQLTPARNLSITAPQALSLLNNDFMLVHSQALARSLSKHSPEENAQIQELFRRLYGRAPSTEEQNDLKPYLRKHGLPNLCRLMLNSNEFLFVD